MSADSTTAGQGLLDRMAIGLSALCLIHCLATAVLVGMASTLGAIGGHPAVHQIALAIAVVLGAVALVRGLRRHRQWVPASVGAAGLGIMAGALFVPHGPAEVVATIFGVCILAAGHFLNSRALA